MGLPARALHRYHRTRPWLLGLSILGVMLGVAVIVAMSLSIHSARVAFQRSAETVAGRATHQILPTSGALSESVFPRVRIEAQVRESAPVVEGSVVSPAWPGQVLTLVGVDPLSEAGIREFLSGSGSGAIELWGQDGVVLPAGLARAAGVGPGDSLTLTSGSGPVQVRVLSTFGEGSRGSGLDMVLADIALAQRLLGMSGSLTRIDLRLPEGPEGDDAAARIQSVLPPDARLLPAGARTAQIQQLTRAFELNLTALSLLSLVFGAFLIYNAVTFSVVQRQGTIGTLRALGTDGRSIARAIVFEGFGIGLVGGVLGIGAGIALGRVLVRLVTQTINDLYYTVSVRGVEVSYTVLAGALVLAVLVSMGAALWPALEATRGTARGASLRSNQEERSARAVVRAARAAVGLAGAAYGVVVVAPPTVAWAFVALTLVLLAMAAVAPWCVVVMSRAISGLLGRWAGPLMNSAMRSTARGLSRTAPAIAALVVAVAVTVGIGGMITSFRGAVASWLGHTLQADVYVSPSALGSSGPSGALSAETVERILALEAVDQFNTYRTLDLAADFGLVQLIAMDLAQRGEPAFRFESGDATTALRAFRTEDAVVVSDPLRYRTGLDTDSTMMLPTPSGEVAFRVAGVFTDYGTERGTAIISRAAYDRYWSDTTTSALGLFARPGVDASDLVRLVREAAADRPVVIRSNRDLRELSLEVFDRTFAVTAALRLLAFVVAFIGIVGALMAIELERGREFGLLRATGLTPRGLWAVMLAETTFLGLLCGAIAAPAGWVLAALMVHVVNRRSFGWGMDLIVGPQSVTQALLLAGSAAALAALYPAWRIARTSPAVALRTE